MNDKTIEVTYGALLYNIGKVVYRSLIYGKTSYNSAGVRYISEIDGGNEILDSIRYHKKNELIHAQHLPLDSNAYITYIADKIVSRRELCAVEDNTDEEELSSCSVPLSSIFNIMFGQNASYVHRLLPLDKEINFPSSKEENISPSDYQQILELFKKELETIKFSEEYINKLLGIMEAYFCYVPSSTLYDDMKDISFYDHSKISAALAACISEFLLDQGSKDYRTVLLCKEMRFLNEKAFLMVSSDFSGIQDFIFNVTSDDALKRLRSRSFFLEIFMENMIDEMLSLAGVARTNLIYSGGGHCYLLLPNTDSIKRGIDEYRSKINRWLLSTFGITLYFTCSYIECSGNELMNIPDKDAPYEWIYKRLSRELSQQKSNRYSAHDIIELNRRIDNPNMRECKICGTESQLTNESNYCNWCEKLQLISSNLLEKDLVILVTNKAIDQYPSLSLPSIEGEAFYHFISIHDVADLSRSQPIIRLYTKNKFYPELPTAIRLYVGDYVYDTRLDQLITSQSHKNLAILRADIDNLGQAFITAFTDRYNTLTRSATFSRHISMFFKYYLNFILAGDMKELKAGKIENAPRKIVTIYAGGDDLFLVGNVNDILYAVIDIDNLFRKYTANMLSISYGLGIYQAKYPLYRSAFETAELESIAKQMEGKNSISLFVPSLEHTYKLHDYQHKVISEKLDLIMKFFRDQPTEQNRGNTFLYNLLEFLNNASDKINIARYAYILARLEPKRDHQNQYKNFSQKMYEWMLNPESRRELITAIYIYIYLTR